MLYYKNSSSEVLKEVQSNEKGLTEIQAHARISKYGYNELKTEIKINKLALFLSQFKSFIIYILLFAVILSIILKEYVDASIILIILLLNALIGFFQELSAQKSLDALKKLNTIQARVFRDGKQKILDSKYLVPGDIIVLEAGDKIPADCRILECSKLKVEESALTGESVPVTKHANTLSKEVQLADQKNMLFSSTTVMEGTCKAVVVATGMKTEIGKITNLIRNTQEELTPLQKKLDDFGKKLGYAIIGICITILVAFTIKEYLASHLTPQVFLDVFLIAVALAVAAVPEGLPAVVTITLSVGVKKLLKRKALVRKLSSVETLGSCDIICTDKTGTLTKNEMTVEKVWNLETGVVEVSGRGYTPLGSLSKKISDKLFEIGFYCNNASLEKEKGLWKITGDPTEAALLVSAKKAKISEKLYKRIDELPFDSNRKMMSVLVEGRSKKQMFTKGATDQLLHKCTHYVFKGSVKLLTKEIKQHILEQNEEFAKKALRVLSFAYKPIQNTKDFKEEKLIFVGLQAMIDPPREDVKDSIQKAKNAGIRVIMITGDYSLTAKAIGEQIGITGEVLTGEDVSKMTDLQLHNALQNNTNIFARVIPEHKQRIVSILQKQNHIVAMTGDGVNDAPALKKANIGVAVGSGTDVAKEAADFVLLDDSFTHIVNAIEEGRGIYDNIQKTLMLLLSGNTCEVLIIFLAVILGWNLPLTAIMLLWINLITDGAPALALSVDPYAKNIMKKKPKNSKEGILSKEKLSLIFVRGILMALVALTIFYLFGGASEDPSKIAVAQSIVFTFVVISETLLVLIIRDYYKTPFFSNKWVWFAVMGSILLQAILLFTPLREIFGISLFNGLEAIVLGISLLVIVISSIILKNIFPLKDEMVLKNP
jgi:Ca2+-transporting ATPase